MKEIVRRLVRGQIPLVAIGFCLFLVSAPVLAVAQPVWPGPSPEQWYWYEPETNLPPGQVEAIFKDAAAARTSFWYSKFPNSLFAIQNTQFEKAKGKSAAGIKLKTSWVGINSAAGTRGSYTCSLSLDAIRQILLFYNSTADGQWQLMTALVDSSYTFFFKNENAARRFGAALASILAQEGFNLKLPRLGITTADLTPAQAEALGKTRIENVLVTSVAIDGPADLAGLRPLDVITEVNGVRIKNNSHFNSLLAEMASGTKISLACLQREKVSADGEERFAWRPKTVEVTIE